MDYTITEAANLTKVRRCVIKALCDFNNINHTTVGKRILITETGVHQLNEYYLKLVLQKLERQSGGNGKNGNGIV